MSQQGWRPAAAPRTWTAPWATRIRPPRPEQRGSAFRRRPRRPRASSPRHPVALLRRSLAVVHGLDVVAVRVEDVRRVVRVAVLRADAGRPVVAPARVHRRGVEGGHLLLALRLE